VLTAPSKECRAGEQTRGEACRVQHW
jgi:hypothetical protein